MEEDPNVCWREGTKNDRFLEVLVTHICTYLAAECRNRSENPTNRKLSIFYIETMFQLFFQLKKKRDQKYFSKKKTSKIFFVDFPENRKYVQKIKA